jgi:hypothetical protein
MSLKEDKGREETGSVGRNRSPSPPRRPYVPPQLRALGSVADLTLGDTGSVTDGGQTTKVTS